MTLISTASRPTTNDVGTKPNIFDAENSIPTLSISSDFEKEPEITLSRVDSQNSLREHPLADKSVDLNAIKRLGIGKQLLSYADKTQNPETVSKLANTTLHHSIQEINRHSISSQLNNLITVATSNKFDSINQQEAINKLLDLIPEITNLKELLLCAQNTKLPSSVIQAANERISELAPNGFSDTNPFEAQIIIIESKYLFKSTKNVAEKALIDYVNNPNSKIRGTKGFFKNLKTLANKSMPEKLCLEATNKLKDALDQLSKGEIGSLLKTNHFKSDLINLATEKFIDLDKPKQTMIGKVKNLFRKQPPTLGGVGTFKTIV